MKLILAAATFVTTANAFGGSSPRLGGNRLFSTALNAGNVGLYYSTATGNTETVAGYIADASGLRADDIGDASDADIQAHDAIIVGGKVSWDFCCVDLLLCRLLIQTIFFSSLSTNLAHRRRHRALGNLLGRMALQHPPQPRPEEHQDSYLRLWRPGVVL